MNSGSKVGSGSAFVVANWPSVSPFEASMSRISTSDVSPKFLLASRSCSVQRARSPSVMNAHLLQAIAAANRKFEIADRNVEHLAQRGRASLRVFVVEHVARSLRVLEEQPGRGRDSDMLQNALIALLGPVVLLAIFVQHAQVQQRADVGGKLGGRAFVQIECDLVVAAAIVFLGQSKQAPAWFGSDSTARSNRATTSAGIAAEGGDRGAALKQVFGRLLDRAGERIENLQRGLRVARHALGVGLTDRAIVGVVAGLGRGRVSCIASSYWPRAKWALAR